MANNVINYAGSSMFPALKAGDVLRVVSYKDRDIRVGDVVVFYSPYGRTPIVHRVVSVSKEGVRTKGDNKLAIDDFILQPSKIIGRVFSIKRGRKNVTIFGGISGRIYAMVLQAGKHIDIGLSFILGPVYRWFVITGIFRKLFSRWIQTRVLCFKCGDGTEMQLLMGRWVIGRRFPGTGRWHIQRPFRLFVDELSLPGAQDIKKDHLEFELSNN
jgi:signal peptidase I